jgi:hypothetical protein
MAGKNTGQQPLDIGSDDGRVHRGVCMRDENRVARFLGELRAAVSIFGMVDLRHSESKWSQLSGVNVECMTYIVADKTETNISETIPATQIIWFRGDFEVQFRAVIEATTKKATTANKKTISSRYNSQFRWSRRLCPQLFGRGKTKYIASTKAVANNIIHGLILFMMAMVEIIIQPRKRFCVVTVLLEYLNNVNTLLVDRIASE